MSTFSVVERTNATYSATMKDADDIAVPLSAITAATITLKDVETGTVINSRDAQNVLNTNNVTIHATSGLLTWNIQAADQFIVTAGVEHELHRAVFDIAYSGGKRLVHEVYLVVENIAGIT